MFDYKKMLQNSQHENRKGVAISKLCTLFIGAKKLW